MSDAFLSRRGGAGLSVNAAVIHVTASVGSTISFSKGGAVIKALGPDKSHINAADNTRADWYYSVSASSYGTWTVTATLGEKTASDTVIVNAPIAYDVFLPYVICLYDNGDVQTPVTGGWSAVPFLDTSYYSAGTLDTAYNGTTCYLSANGETKQISAVTVNKIDVTDYNALYIEVSDYTFRGAGYKELDLVSTRADASSPVAKVSLEGTGTFSIDVSSITGSYYIGLYLNSGTSGACHIGFTRVFLER